MYKSSKVTVFSTTTSADHTKAKVIVEDANGPTSSDGYAILKANDAYVIPEIHANAGSVIVSYLKWMQNLHREHWGIDEVNERLKKRITQSFKHVLHITAE